MGIATDQVCTFIEILFFNVLLPNQKINPYFRSCCIFVIVTSRNVNYSVLNLSNFVMLSNYVNQTTRASHHNNQTNKMLQNLLTQLN